METVTTNTTAHLNYVCAKDAILDIIDEYGFTTSQSFDQCEMENKIIEAIRKNIEGNVNYASVTG